MITKPNGAAACTWFWSLMLSAGGTINAAHAADVAAPPPAAAYGYAAVGPIIDPRCRIIPQPQANLFGDTARFRPTAVCLSRGLYADSLLFP